MSSTKQKSLDVLVDLTKDQTDQAATTLSKAVAEKTNAENQLNMLKDYREDYANRLNGAGKNGITASNYHNFTRFLATLDEAIMQQTRIITHLDYNIQKCTDDWRKCQRKLHSYETLQTRQRQQQLAIENRLDQIATDEVSATVHRRRQQNQGYN